jgi:hypothetical protein
MNDGITPDGLRNGKPIIGIAPGWCSSQYRGDVGVA